MQSKLLQLHPKLSKIWLFLVAAVFFVALTSFISYHSYLLLLFIIIYALTFYKFQTGYCIKIASDTRQITLIHKNKNHVAQLVNCYQITFLLTCITLHYNNKTVTRPIFIDSLSLNQYKCLRMFLQWN
mgnify:CR=1 FL=1